MNLLDISAGQWLNEPLSATLTSEGFVVEATAHSDFWRTTSYGFIHDDGHALLNDFPQDSSLEVSWVLDYDQQFDQAGMFVYSDAEHWIKAGVEFADGFPQLGAVVTNELSDWSVAPVPQWQGKEVHLRLSRHHDALTIRAKAEGAWQLVRLVPLDERRHWRAGLFLASPSRAGLKVTFTQLRSGAADSSLH